MKKVMASVLFGLALLSFTHNTQAQAEDITRQKSMGVLFQPNNTTMVYTVGYAIKGLPLSIGPRTQLNYGIESKILSSFIGATANYHFGQHININHEKIDLYAGATYGMGLYVNFAREGAFANNSQIYLQTGGRYFLTPRLGIYGQANIGVNRVASLLNGTSFEVGLTFRRK
jgi:hypothetical protein